MKQSNYHFQYSIEIESTQDKVWRLLTDVDRWKDWDTELISSTLKDNFCVNAQGILVPKKGPQLRFYISELIPTTSYTFKTKMPVGYLEIKRSLKQKGALIEFTDDIQFTGFLRHIFGLMLGGGFRTALPKVMQNFKSLAEQS